MPWDVVAESNGLESDEGDVRRDFGRGKDVSIGI